MNQKNTTADQAPAGEDLLNLTVETFEIDELNELDVNAAKIEVSLCSSTCSSSCG